MSEKLETIIAEAQAEESAGAREQEQQAQAEAASSVEQEADELAGLIEMAAGLAFPAFPKLREVYTPETCRRLGRASAAPRPR